MLEDGDWDEFSFLYAGEEIANSRKARGFIYTTGPAPFPFLRNHLYDVEVEVAFSDVNVPFG